MVDASFQFIFRLKNREEAQVGFTLNFSIKKNNVKFGGMSLTVTHITTTLYSHCRCMIAIHHSPNYF